LLIAVGISYAQAAWQGPTATPPNGNADAPLNVSAIGQSKAGGLILNTGGALNGLVVELGKFIAKGSVKFTNITNCDSLQTDSSGNVLCVSATPPSVTHPLGYHNGTICDSATENFVAITNFNGESVGRCFEKTRRPSVIYYEA